MFQRELDLAVSWGEQMQQHLNNALNQPRFEAVAEHLNRALDAAWRMESGLGELLAIEEPKRRAARIAQSVMAAKNAFDILKPALMDADEARSRPEAEMKAWINRFLPQAEEALEAALEAKRMMPPIETHRISVPAGEARTEDARAIVSISRTSNQNLGIDDVERLLLQALEPLGGIGQFVRPGQTVLLKPNQTLYMLADEGATTDPRLVAAAARLCYQAGAGRVIVGESSGGGSDSSYVMHITGVKMLAQRAGAEIVDFHTCEQREANLMHGRVIKQIMLPAPLLDADVIINLPKMKTHNWDWISGALKNWVGILRPDVRERHHDVQTFDEYIDLHFHVPAKLHVMDAIVRGVGNGPGANDGEFYGAILASTDPVALDAVAAQILGFHPSAIGFVQHAAQHGLGVGDPDQIAVVGVPLAQAIKPAKPPIMGVDIYNANVIVGTGITRAGTLGHFKSMGDIFLKMGTWGLVQRLHGKPTILVGNAEDPLFRDHLKEGPYIVMDDAAPDRYKHHPDVFFIPGHPVLHNLESLLLVGLRIPTIGHLALQGMAATRTVDSRLEFGAPKPIVPVVRAGLGVTRRLPYPVQVGLTLGMTLTVLLGIGFGVKRLVVKR